MTAEQSLIDALTRSADQAVFVVDRSGLVRECNHAGRSLVPRESIDFHGQSLDDLLVLTRGGKPLKPMTLVRECGERGEDAAYAADIALKTVPDSSMFVEIGVYPVTESGSAPEDWYAVITIRDLEEKRRLRNDLRYIQHAENIARAVTGVANEITDGSTALFGQIDLLQTETGQDLSELYAAVRRIQRLGHRLSAFSRLRPDSDENVDSAHGNTVQQVEETIISAVDLALSGTSTRATFHIVPPNRPLAITPERLNQVLFNLVTNAVESMAEGGVVHVEAEAARDARALEIVIRDEGHGMDSRTMRDAIKPYFTTREWGIGMGLTITSSILEECGGRLALSTDPGFGTTVSVTVPFMFAGDMVSGTPRPVAANRQDPDIDGLSVLLVEDDNLVRRSMERSLRRLGCDVTTVENGERALPVVKARIGTGSPFRLLITDLTMPGRIDGAGLLRRVRELDPDIPAILSTGTLHLHRGRPPREAGFQAILRKPFGMEQLRDSILTACRTTL